MLDCIRLDPCPHRFYPGATETKVVSGFETATNLQLSSGSVCWAGDLGRLRPKVWSEMRQRLEKSIGFDVEDEEKVPCSVWSCAFSSNRVKGRNGLVLEAINTFGIIFKAEQDLRLELPIAEIIGNGTYSVSEESEQLFSNLS